MISYASVTYSFCFRLAIFKPAADLAAYWSCPQRYIDFLGADPWPELAELNATDAVNQRWP